MVIYNYYLYIFSKNPVSGLIQYGLKDTCY